MKRHVWLWPALLLASVGPLGSLARAEEHKPVLGTGMGRPEDLSLDGWRSDWLFDVTTVSVTVLFIIMVGIIVWSMLKYREGHQAHYEHGIGKSHLMLTALISSVIFFGVDGTLLVNAFADVHKAFWNFPGNDQTPLTVEVLAQQWAWNIRYPGPDGKFNTPDDVVTLNDMHVPVGRPVFIKLQSKDVIHSFYLPNFRVKQDAVPGVTTKMWFQAEKPALVEIGCAQHCGTNHYKMRGELTIHAKDDFDAWYKAAAADAERRYDPQDTEARWGWDWEAN